MSMTSKIRILLEMVKFEHTIFALPFALISVILASENSKTGHGLPELRQVFWVIMAMVGARSAAMAFNRIVDAEFDAENARTKVRAIPAGLISRGAAVVFTVCFIGLFEVAAWQLNLLCLYLSPVALLFVLGYSYTKRFTFLCHMVLGAAIGLAPVGAWVAIKGSFHIVPVVLGVAVLCWIGGFDIIYALQDEQFDLDHGLKSIPQRLGKKRALVVSRFLHVFAIASLIAVGMLASLGTMYFIGAGVAAALIFYEQSIVTPSDLSRVNLAFFTLNGWVSISLLFFVVVDRFAR